MNLTESPSIKYAHLPSLLPIVSDIELLWLLPLLPGDTGTNTVASPKPSTFPRGNEQLANHKPFLLYPPINFGLNSVISQYLVRC